MPDRFLRKVIRIKAEDSPNVKLGLTQTARGETPTNEILVPGVLTYEDYLHRRKTWDKQRQCEGLDAEWYAGPQLMLFPPEWLARCVECAVRRGGNLKGSRRSMGVDAAEGGDNTVWVIGDMTGVIYLESAKTPDTSVIPKRTAELMRDYGVEPESVLFDRGGGGKQHADALRRQGYDVRTVAFGESVNPEPRRGMKTFGERKEEKEERYEYKNRRAEMYHEASRLCGPRNEGGFAISGDFLNRPRLDGGPPLASQLGKMPRLEDDEGRYWLPPKGGTINEELKKKGITKTLTEIIGCSPDEADAFVLMVRGLLHPKKKRWAGVM